MLPYPCSWDAGKLATSHSSNPGLRTHLHLSIIVLYCSIFRASFIAGGGMQTFEMPFSY
jgi:hypothetical protein